MIGIFIGYPFNMKGYKVLILDTLKIVVSRNVISHENIFPFHKSSLDISTSDHLLVVVQENSSSIFVDFPASHFLDTKTTLANSSSPISQPLNNPLPTRRSTRTHSAPSNLNDYIAAM